MLPSPDAGSCLGWKELHVSLAWGIILAWGEFLSVFSEVWGRTEPGPSSAPIAAIAECEQLREQRMELEGVTCQKELQGAWEETRSPSSTLGLCSALLWDLLLPTPLAPQMELGGWFFFGKFWVGGSFSVSIWCSGALPVLVWGCLGLARGSQRGKVVMERGQQQWEERKWNFNRD